LQPPDEGASEPVLPPLEGDADLLCSVYKRYKYVTLAFTRRDGRGATQAFTVHQVEARKLLAALDTAVQGPVDTSFQTHRFGGVEGVYLGGPPEKAQLTEFSDKG
jgi:hypothetical protein